MHCLVTGASGYIGRALLPALARQKLHLSAQHCRGAIPRVSNASIDVLKYDFGASPWKFQLEGVDVVFHLAGIAHQRADVQAYERINVQAPLSLAEQALAAGVKRFVFVSSVKAQAAQYDATGALVAISDASNAYAQSKALAEQGLKAICQNSALELVIVRPALVYSEQALGHLRWLRRWTAWHLPAPPVGGERSMIALDDLVDLLTLLVGAPLRTPLLMTVTDEERYSTRRLHAALCAATDRRPWLPSPPAFVWQSLCNSWDVLRAEQVGGTWARMTDDECYLNSGLDALSFRPALNFEASIGAGKNAP